MVVQGKDEKWMSCEGWAASQNSSGDVFIDTKIACPIEAVSCHYLRNGLADVGQVTGEVIRYEQPEPMRL